MPDPINLEAQPEALTEHAEMLADVAAAVARGLAIGRFPPEASNRVTCTGHALHPVIWCGRQWAVTEYGLEARDGRYAVEIRQLRVTERGDRAHWAKHLAAKPWVDKADAICAIVALNLVYDEQGTPTGVEPE